MIWIILINFQFQNNLLEELKAKSDFKNRGVNKLNYKIFYTEKPNYSSK